MLSKFPHLLALTATLSFSLTPPGVAQTVDQGTLDQLGEMTDILADMADVTADAADLPGVVIDAVGTGADDLVDYVGSRIAYVPYTGVLRGADGTLRSGYGNSYDQSLALITLLRRAGYEAQLMVGPQTAQGTFSETRQDFPEPDFADDITDLTEELDDLVAQLVAQGLIEQPADLPAPEMPQTDPAIAEAAAAAAVDLLGLTDFTPAAERDDLYALVRYRQATADPWTFADPAKNAVLNDLDTAPYTLLNAQVPQEHLHMTKVSVVVESEGFGSVPVATLEAPSSNLADEPISIGFATTAQLADPENASPPDETDSIIFISDQLPQQVITLEGQVIPLEEAASAFGAVFQTGASLLADATASIEQEDATRAPSLDRIVLTVGTSSPVQSSFTEVSRTIYSKNTNEQSNEATNEADIKLALLNSIQQSFVFFSGFGAPLPYETAAAQINSHIAMFDALLNPTTDLAIVNSELNAIYASFLFGQMGNMVAERAGATHTKASVISIATHVINTDAEQRLLLLSDVIIDGRSVIAPIESLSLAVGTAATEEAAMDRLSVALQLEEPQSSSFMALTNALEQQVTPLSAADYLSNRTASGDALEQQHLDFVDNRVSAGMQIAVWPSDNWRETVWLEYDPSSGTSRLASGLGTGNTATEEATLVFLIGVAGLVGAALVTNYKCVSGASDRGVAQKCKECAAIAITTGTYVAGVGVVAVPIAGALIGAVFTVGYALAC